MNDFFPPLDSSTSGDMGDNINGETCTIMLRNIACKFGQEDVKRVLDGLGLSGKFSYIYVPCVAVHGSNMGYGFVGFRSTAYAEECYRLCHGRVFGQDATTSKKLCQVVMAHTQGGLDAVWSKPRRRQTGGRQRVLICNDPIPEFNGSPWERSCGARPFAPAATGPAEMLGSYTHSAVTIAARSGFSEHAFQRSDRPMLEHGAKEYNFAFGNGRGHPYGRFDYSERDTTSGDSIQMAQDANADYTGSDSSVGSSMTSHGPAMRRPPGLMRQLTSAAGMFTDVDIVDA